MECLNQAVGKFPFDGSVQLLKALDYLLFVGVGGAYGSVSHRCSSH